MRETVGLFLDFSKVFETINNKLLLKKFEHYGIRGACLNWIKRYLTNHSRTFPTRSPPGHFPPPGISPLGHFPLGHFPPRPFYVILVSVCESDLQRLQSNTAIQSLNINPMRSLSGLMRSSISVESATIATGEPARQNNSHRLSSATGGVKPLLLTREHRERAWNRCKVDQRMHCRSRIGFLMMWSRWKL